MTVVSLAAKFAAFSEHWAPKIVGSVDDYDIKIVRVQGDFVWHQHADADEMFFVIEGELRMDFRDRSETVRAGELIVVPKGVEHKPYADAECCMMLIERKGLANTGDGPESERTRAPEPI